jgi:predicted nucleic acid-binding protein
VSTLQAVVVDTDAFSHLFTRHGNRDPRLARWRELLVGRRVLISFQTRAEALAGAHMNQWGERRVVALLEILDRTPTIRADDEVVSAYATLVAECRRQGHALQDKQHTGDRWIAASAIAKGVALLAGDGIYQNAPGLNLLT